MGTKTSPPLALRAGFVAGFRPYLQAIIEDESPGVILLHWSRQIGKSYVLAAWTFFIEELQEKWGMSRIRGVNFATTEPISERQAAEGRKHETARVTEIMATALLAVFEDGLIEIPADQELRDDLRKPEKITSPGGRVSIAATRDEAGHADGFWSLALAVGAGERGSEPCAISGILPWWSKWIYRVCLGLAVAGGSYRCEIRRWKPEIRTRSLGFCFRF